MLLKPAVGIAREFFNDAKHSDPRIGKNCSASFFDACMTVLMIPLLQIPSMHLYDIIRRGRITPFQQNVKQLFGIKKLLCRNELAKIIDKLEPHAMDGLFHKLLLYVLASAKGLLFRSKYGMPTAIDGTGYISYRKTKCPECTTIRSAKSGTPQHRHTVVIAAAVATDASAVIPILVEPVVQQDGAEKNDCEYRAFLRLLPRLRELPIKILALGDDLYAKQPICRGLLASGYNFIFTCKPDSHKTAWGYWCEPTVVTKRVNGIRTVVEYFNDIPLTDDKDALRVNLLIITEIANDGSAGYHNTFCTNIEITDANCHEVAALGRLRWGIENGTNNVLKHGGYEFQHSYVHGHRHGSNNMATMLIAGLAIHAISLLLLNKTEELRKSVREMAGDLRTAMQLLVFTGFAELIERVLMNINT
jgi:hypothetical protein